MLKCIKNEMLEEVFSNLEIILRMYACISVTNCTGERLFLILKRVKNYMRPTMRNEHLNALALLIIETDLLKSVLMIFQKLGKSSKK